MPTEVLAQAKPIVSVTPKVDTPRSQAPLLFDATVTWNFPTVLEGTLQLEFFVAQRRLHTWVSRELALSNSEITLPVMAPSVIVNESNESLDIRVTFHTEKEIYTYEDELNMLVWPDWKRVFVVGVVHPELSQISNSSFVNSDGDELNKETEWSRFFRLDNILPDKRLSNHFVTRSIRVDPRIIATQPLELVTYDMLVITPDGLQKLSELQLTSIAEWVEAGGAVCVQAIEVTGNSQQEFVKRILESDVISPKIRFDSDGTVNSLLSRDSQWQLAAPGAGRALVTFEAVDGNSDEWQEVVLKLWRMRADQRNHVLVNGEWHFPEEEEDSDPGRYFMKSLDNPLYRPMEIPFIEEDRLQQQIMPDRIEGVPFRSVALLLLACLFAIGPGDYLLLGALGKRRWTWILFPVVAVGFAMYTIQLAQSHMGATDHQNSLRIIDITVDGQPARVSDFRLLFAASEKDVTTECSEEFVVPIENRPDQRKYNYGAINYAPDDPLTVIGRAPLNYTTIRAVHQWKPQLSRSTTIGSSHNLTLPSFDWQLVTAEALADLKSRQKLFRQITDAMPNAQIICLHQKQALFTPVADEQPENAVVFTGNEGTVLTPLLQFVLDTSMNLNYGPFRVFSQISPNASGTAEDLALLDTSDPSQYLLIIADSDGQGNHNVYRRLLRSRDSDF